jgi:hypothetical protein
MMSPGPRDARGLGLGWPGVELSRLAGWAGEQVPVQYPVDRVVEVPVERVIERKVRRLRAMLAWCSVGAKGAGWGAVGGRV